MKKLSDGTVRLIRNVAGGITVWIIAVAVIFGTVSTAAAITSMVFAGITGATGAELSIRKSRRIREEQTSLHAEVCRKMTEALHEDTAKHIAARVASGHLDPSLHVWISTHDNQKDS